VKGTWNVCVDGKGEAGSLGKENTRDISSTLSGICLHTLLSFQPNFTSLQNSNVCSYAKLDVD